MVGAGDGIILAAIGAGSLISINKMGETRLDNCALLGCNCGRWRRRGRLVLFTFAEDQELTAHASPRRAVVHLPPHHPHAVRASDGPFSIRLTLGAEN
jgi:hypothetical protein